MHARLPTCNQQKSRQVSQLHPVDPRFADQDAGVDAGAENRHNAIKTGGRIAGRSGGGGRGRGGRGGGAGGAGASSDERQPINVPPLHFEWVAVLWRLALGHEHPLVQKTAMRTLLKRDWRPAFVSQVPGSFLSACLLPALNSAIHHRPGGAAGGGFDAGAAAARLFGAWAAGASDEEVRGVISVGLDDLAAPGSRDMTRSGVLAHVACLEAAAGAAAACGKLALRGVDGGGSGAAWATAQLDKLPAFLATRSWPHGAAAHAACSCRSIQLAAHLAPGGGAGTAAFGASLRLLAALPVWCAAPAGGELYALTRAWLLGSSTGQKQQQQQQQQQPACDESGGGDTSEAPSPALELLEDEARQLWSSFFSASRAAAGAGGGEGDESALRRPSSARDYALWSVDCQAWTR
jgi:hypothetical protein